MASPGCTLSLWLACVLQCLLMLIDWEEYGHHGVSTCRRITQSLWCDCVIQCLLMFVVWMESKGTMGSPPCRRKTFWPQCNANSWMIKTAFLFLSLSLHPPNSPQEWQQPFVKWGLPQLNGSGQKSRATLWSPDSQSSLFQTRLTLHANEELSWLPLSLSPTIEFVPMPQS